MPIKTIKKQVKNKQRTKKKSLHRKEKNTK